MSRSHSPFFGPVLTIRFLDLLEVLGTFGTNIPVRAPPYPVRHLLQDCYTVCVGQHLLPVPREHIKRSWARGFGLQVASCQVATSHWQVRGSKLCLHHPSSFIAPPMWRCFILILIDVCWSYVTVRDFVAHPTQFVAVGTALATKGCSRTRVNAVPSSRETWRFARGDRWGTCTAPQDLEVTNRERLMESYRII